MEKKKLADCIRVLSADAVQEANSGHPGMPMGMADIAQVLWNDHLKHNPSNPKWVDRDRFVLSNGHGSMLLYSLLHLTGYPLSIEDIKKFRQFGSHTAGHPELDLELGIETTTGPLGQGITNAVGMALAESILASKFNKDGHSIVDHFTYVFLGDGCLMEGISHEACSLAGTLNLGKLICIYDDNGISIDGEVDGWFDEDVCSRFKSYGWHVIEDVDGHDAEAISKAISEAKASDKPSLIDCKTIIGFGSPNKAGTADTHGAPLGDDELSKLRESLGWDHDRFVIPDEMKSAWDCKVTGQSQEEDWNARFKRYQSEHPESADEFLQYMDDGKTHNEMSNLNALIDELREDADTVATRKSSLVALNALKEDCTNMIGGSADLTGSVCTYHDASKPISKNDHDGNYIFYGVREFGMSAIMNGMALHGGLIPYAGTFLTFSDYSRNAIRMAAMMELGVIHVLTHDSIGLGEDGPTHQPVEHVPSLRLIPGLDVWRPCDTLETAVAWKTAAKKRNCPSALILTRQSLPQYDRTLEMTDNIQRGGYVLKGAEDSEPDAIIIATGSEVQYAVNASNALESEGLSVRVVSMPCVEIFEQQSDEYKNSVIPKGLEKIMVIEASMASAWKGYAGHKGIVIGMEGFGASAPAPELFKHYGFSDENVIEKLKEMINS
ncbi:MAG TPA: transketolase [Gammaproteobacteria bacterium]|nr:transketolase [Gammaproteobacteria bacterium]